MDCYHMHHFHWKFFLLYMSSNLILVLLWDRFVRNLKELNPKENFYTWSYESKEISIRKSYQIPWIGSKYRNFDMRYNLLEKYHLCLSLLWTDSCVFPALHLNGFMQFSCIGFEVVGVLQTCIFFLFLCFYDHSCVFMILCLVRPTHLLSAPPLPSIKGSFETKGF